MKLLLCALSVLCLVAVISAKKAIEENLDPLEPETQDHSSKKYTKDYQKPHHHGGHKHKKHLVAEELPKVAETKPKDTPVEIPEPEVKLQSDIETSKKAIKEEKRKSETEDLHLQDLTYEETLKKDKKKKKGHHGAHHAEVLESPKGKGDHKLFAEQEVKNPEEKVIEDSFEPLKETRADKGKGKDKKSKDKSKGKKKATEKSKDKGKKSKEGKRKNKDKSKKSKEGKRKW